MTDLFSKRRWFFIAGLVAIIISLVALGIFGLKPGIDFSSGSLLTLSFEEEVSTDEVKTALAEMGYPNAIVQTTGAGDIIIRSTVLSGNEKEEIELALAEKFGNLEERGFENIEPTIAQQTVRTSIIGVAIAVVAILLYMALAFRKMPRPFRYGVCAIIALLNDIIITLGVFAILGEFFNIEANLLLVIGVLTVIGYSVNNVVVVFDRIRDNRGMPGADFAAVVGKSVTESMARSFNTSITTLIAVLAFLLFIGANIQNFAIALIAGIVAGTYSSLFIAPPILVAWEEKDWASLIQPRGS
jgi:preprotein translocase subunit SecF